MSDHITLVGNIVGDLEQRSTRGGGTVAAFRLAVGERRLDRERGEWVDGHTSFYAVSVFGELGAHALQSFQKGERVILSGRLRLREWETESKRGVSADVTAEAIGHDLRWGVSRFERAPRPEPANAAAGPSLVAAASSIGATAANSDADGWALPGATSSEGIADGAVSPAAPVSAAETVEAPF